MDFLDKDEVLIAAALKGSSRAWEKLVRRYERKIYNYSLRLTGNNTDAMDLVQEVFLGVYRNLHRFRGDAKFSSWIFRIAHNKAIDLNRRNFLILGKSFDFNGNGVDEVQYSEPDGNNEPDFQLMKGQQNRKIQSLLQCLPIEQRLVIELKIFQSQTFAEIAEMQDISENTAKTRFYTALRILKEHLKEESHVLS